MTLLIAFACFIFLLLFLVIHGSFAKNRWGINLDPVRCSHCGTPLPTIRKPTSFRQTLWGGSTCSVCGTEVDKWGREVNKSAVRS